jgi:CRISPR-associated Cas5-like protein
MVWVCGTYTFASTFSYRIPYFSSSYALSAPAPSPSTIKLAIVASAINRTGNVNAGKTLFKKICTSEVLMELPERISVFKVFLKRLKKKRQEQAFEITFGIREYIIYNGPLKIYLNVPEDSLKATIEALRNIQFLGTSDSICTCTNTTKVTRPPTKCAKPHFITEQEKMNGVIFLLTDFTNKATFDAVNPYTKKKLRKDEDIISKPYIFPIKVIKKDKNCTVYTTL